MVPPTLADFNYKLDDYCFFAEEDSKVLRIAHRMQVLDSLQDHEDEAIILSFFYTDKKEILDLVVFIAIPMGEEVSYQCFYFKEFVHRAYNVGGRLKEWVPADLLEEQAFRRELLEALNFLLPQLAPDTQAEAFAERDSWGFYFKRYKGWEFPVLN
jgi:hypothetical protein